MKAIFAGTLVGGFSLVNVVNDAQAAEYAASIATNGLHVEALDVVKPTVLDPDFQETGGQHFTTFQNGLGDVTGVSIYGPFEDYELAEAFGEDHVDGDHWEIFEAQQTSRFTPFQMEVAKYCDAMLQDDAVGSAYALIREENQTFLSLVRLELMSDTKGLNMENLEQYEAIIFDGGNTSGDLWKHISFPKMKAHFFVDENPL